MCKISKEELTLAARPAWVHHTQLHTQSPLLLFRGSRIPNRSSCQTPSNKGPLGLKPPYPQLWTLSCYRVKPNIDLWNWSFSLYLFLAIYVYPLCKTHTFTLNFFKSNWTFVILESVVFKTFWHCDMTTSLELIKEKSKRTIFQYWIYIGLIFILLLF